MTLEGAKRQMILVFSSTYRRQHIRFRSAWQQTNLKGALKFWSISGHLGLRYVTNGQCYDRYVATLATKNPTLVLDHAA